MNNSDKYDFEQLMMGICLLYGSKPLTKPLMRIYFNALQSSSFEEVEMGVSKHTVDPKHGTFMPKPADIIRQIESTTISIENMAEASWHTVIGEMSRIGSYGTLKLEDGRALAAVKAIGGWKNLCSMTQDKHVWAKKEFMAAYDCYATTPIELLPEKLPGRVELENNKLAGGEASKFKQGLEDYLSRKGIEQK